MKRIMFVIGIMGNGGAERVIAALANTMVRSDISVRIVTIFGSRQDYTLDSNIELCHIECENSFSVFRTIERMQKLRKAIRDFSPDCIVSFLADVNIYTILTSIGMKIPVIVSERNDPQKSPKQKWMRKLRNVLYPFANGYVFQTQDAAVYFDGILKNKKTTIIPNPLTPDLPTHNDNINSSRLITACRLNPQKNLKLMIDAVRDVINGGVYCTLDIYGDGPLKNELINYIDEIKMREYIQLKGFSKDIYNEMVNSAGFLISSDYEGISNSMLEALAIGVPVVATDCPVGGARMFIHHNENGLLVPVGDCKKFKMAVQELLVNKEKVRQMGEKAKQIREQLNVNIITAKWLSFIDSVVNEEP